MQDAPTPHDAPAKDDDAMPTRRSSGDLDPKLLEILVCPVTKAALTYDRERSELVSRSARLAYPVRDGIPIMLPDEARELSDDECA